MSTASLVRGSEVFNRDNRELTPAAVEALLRRFLSAQEVAGFEANLGSYQRALVHRSYALEHDAAKLHKLNAACPPGCLPLQARSYECLEFLGDAVLGLAVAAYLCARYPTEDEGFLSRMRSKLVNGQMLTHLCRKHTSLPDHVVVGAQKGVSSSSSSSAPDPSGNSLKSLKSGKSVNSLKSIGHFLDDVFEAFLGAVFMDRGFDLAARWIVGFLEENVDFAELAADLDDDKSVLNRHYLRTHGYVPVLEKLNDTTVRLMTPAGAVIATGIGATVREAHDQAARKALGEACVRPRAGYRSMGMGMGMGAMRNAE
jgi:ribonuclease-3